MAGDLKSDIINSAYSLIRVSGKLIEPLPEDYELALSRLESMMGEFNESSIKVGYNFEESPDIASEHGMKTMLNTAVSSNLALRLLPDFGKDPTVQLMAMANAGLSLLHAKTVRVNKTQYPANMPIGSGNRWASMMSYNYFQEPEDSEAVKNAEQVSIGDIDDYTESFDSWLKNGSAISSYTIYCDDGLIITNESNTDTTVSYRMEAIGSDSTSSSFFQVKIIVTDDSGRKKTVIKTFEIVE